MIRATSDGFPSTDPRASVGGVSAPVTDLGPDDLGATFDFDFGPLAPGDSTSFKLFFGGASNAADAEAALGAVGAEVYTMGKPSIGGVCADGPAVFVVGFAAVGGATIFDPPKPEANGDPHCEHCPGRFE